MCSIDRPFISVAGGTMRGQLCEGVTGEQVLAPTPPHPTPRVCLSVPALEEAPPPSSQQLAASLSLSLALSLAPPLSSSVPVASLGVGASCVTTKVVSSRRSWEKKPKDGYAVSQLNEELRIDTDWNKPACSYGECFSG
ncbi:unnamed protein product [Gadus morhua 'NCC']